MTAPSDLDFATLQSCRSTFSESHFPTLWYNYCTGNVVADALSGVGIDLVKQRLSETIEFR